MNVTNPLLISQSFSEKTFLLDKFELNLEVFESWSITKRAVFNLLIHFDNRYSSIFASQTCFAYMLGVCRATINRLLSELFEEGWIIKIYNHRHTSFYFLRDWVNDYKKRLSLSSIFANFRYLKLSLLSPFQNADLDEHVTPSIKDYLFINKRYGSNGYPVHDLRTRAYVGDKKITVNYKKEKQGYEAMSLPLSRHPLGQLPLTLHGKIKLCAFSDEVISSVYASFVKQKDLREPFVWFFKACMNETRRRQIQPDWARMQKYMIEYAIDPQSPVIELKKSCKGIRQGSDDNAQYIVRIKNKIRHEMGWAPATQETPEAIAQNIIKTLSTDSFKKVDSSFGLSFNNRFIQSFLTPEVALLLPLDVQELLRCRGITMPLREQESTELNESYEIDANPFSAINLPF